MNHATAPLAEIERQLALGWKAKVIYFEPETKRREPGCFCHLEEGDSPCAVHDRGYQEFVASASASCGRCPNCGNPPCEACLAGGVCDWDYLGCYCGDANLDEFYEAQGSDDLDAEGELP